MMNISWSMTLYLEFLILKINLQSQPDWHFAFNLDCLIIQFDYFNHFSWLIVLDCWLLILIVDFGYFSSICFLLYSCVGVIAQKIRITYELWIINLYIIFICICPLYNTILMDSISTIFRSTLCLDPQNPMLLILY